jgi:hypothetical protein
MEPLIKITVPVEIKGKTPAEAAVGEDTVLMEFETRVHLTIGTNNSIVFTPGVHPVPTRYADHWYLKAHGVKRYKVPTTIRRQLEAETKAS